MIGIWLLWATTQGPLNKGPSCKECHKFGNAWVFIQPEAGEENIMCSGFQKCACRQPNLEHQCNTYDIDYTTDPPQPKYEWRDDIASNSTDGWKCACCKKGTTEHCVAVGNEFAPCRPNI